MGRGLGVAIMTCLVLAGCGPDDRKRERANVQLAANGKPVPNATPSPPVPLARMYLTSFAGRWGVQPLDCDISRGDTGGVLDIRDDHIAMTKGSGRITRVAVARPDNITIDAALNEGDRHWSATMNLALIIGGTQLVRTDPDGRKFLYTRC